MNSLLIVAFVLLLVISSIFDFKYYRIPNWATYPAFLLALPVILAKRDAFFLLVFAMATLITISFGRWIGSGDIKLGALIAIYTHLFELSQYWIFAAIFLGGLYGALTRKKSIPFAPFMSLGVALVNLVN